MESGSFFSRLPKWLRVLLIIASIITLVYWLGFIVYKTLSAIRVVGSFIFEKRNYWTFIGCIVILLIGTLVVAQFWLGLDPIGHLQDFVLEKFELIKEWISNQINK